MPKTNFKNFARQKNSRAFRLQTRDFNILGDIADYRFLDTQQIAALYTGGKVTRNLQRRLRYLFNAGYLDRPPQQVALGIIQAALSVGQVGRGEDKTDFFEKRTNHFIYGLGNKGAALLKEHRPELKSRVNWMDKNRSVGHQQLWHVMMISKFRVALQLALQKHKTAKLVEWQQGDQARDYVRIKSSYDGKHRRIPINPDGYFVIQDERGRLPFSWKRTVPPWTTAGF